MMHFTILMTHKLFKKAREEKLRNNLLYSIDFIVISLWNLNHWKQKIFAIGLQEKNSFIRNK